MLFYVSCGYHEKHLSEACRIFNFGLGIKEFNITGQRSKLNILQHDVEYACHIEWSRNTLREGQADIRLPKISKTTSLGGES
jgi:hypothetical protein